MSTNEKTESSTAPLTEKQGWLTTRKRKTKAKFTTHNRTSDEQISTIDDKENMETNPAPLMEKGWLTTRKRKRYRYNII